MSSASELATSAVPETPFDIIRTATAELVVLDLAAAERFYVDLLGLVVSERDERTLYLRGWEERLHHSLVLREGPVAGVRRLSFRVRAERDLDALAADFAARGCETSFSEGEHPGLGRALHATDPFGFPLAFFHEISQFDTQLQRFHLQHGGPIARIDHVNLHSPDVEATFRFWKSLGFRCTEYISTDGDDERITGAWLARKSTVHDVALTAGRGPRLHHLGFAVPDTSGVLRACDQLAAAGYAASIERGPGRHGVSNAFFVYLRDPSGHRIELYACDYYTGDPDHKPLRWSAADASCRSFWGARAPDSWYLESSVVLGPDGQPVGLADADVDERDSFRGEVAQLN
ncbi:MAG TPA: 3,4-dihydroxyphenylacetate 2,3-dioxygenase [Gaiellales bacterium]|jgi:3,4-dihydroxyphenylacetate 2,3-dioxygenase